MLGDNGHIQSLVSMKVVREVVMDLRVNGSWSRSLKPKAAAEMGR